MPTIVRRAAAHFMSNKSDAVKAKRKELSALSQLIKQQIEIGDLEAETVNEGLIETYSDGEEVEFNTFHQWKDKGFKIKKGSKAFLVWGKPRQVPVPDSDDEDDEFKFWPLCYLFSEEQVEQRQLVAERSEA